MTAAPPTLVNPPEIGWAEFRAALVPELRLAAREPWVRLGIGAVVMIIVGSLTPAYLPQNSPWWRLVRAVRLDGIFGKVLGTALVLGGLLLLTQAWLASRRLLARGLHHWAILALWSLPLLFAPPVFSHDAYSYAAQGWLVHNGLNPYEVGPGVLPGAFADQSPWVWRFTPTPYGPLSLQLQHLIVDACGRQPYLSAMMMRVPAVLGVVLIAVFIPKIARLMGTDVRFACWFATLNPILITDFVGGAHNDAQMVGLVVLGVWLAATNRMLLGAVIIGVAASIKQPAFLAAFAIGFVGHPLVDLRGRALWRGLGRVALSCAVAIASFAAISVATGFDFGWLNAINVPGSVLTISPFTVVGQGLQLLLNLGHLDPSGHLALTLSRGVGLGLTAVVVLGLAATVGRTKPLRFLAWSYLAVALFGPALHGWYMMWGGVFLPLTRPSGRVVRMAVATSVLLLSYAAINLLWRNGVTWRNGALGLGAAALALFIWLALHLHSAHEAPLHEEDSDA